MTYRNQFASQPLAEAYDREQYGAGTYSGMLWRIEQEQLRLEVQRLRLTHQRVDYLDFASGTGRVLHFLADFVDNATGIEISSAMAERARDHGRSRVLCTDITIPDCAIEAKYDLITAFRFLLNAEPDLRASGLAALAARLRDDSSRLLVNNHGNLFSYKLAGRIFEKERRRGKAVHKMSGNVMSHRDVLALFRGAGLEMVGRRGSGVIPARLYERFPLRSLSRIESWASRTWAATLGVNQLYVVRRISTEGARPN